MSKYRTHLPQLHDKLFLTDGGLETTLIYHGGVEIPYFAAFDLLKDAGGTEVLRSYFSRYAELARAKGVGIVLEAPTWRANPDWAAKLGYDAVTLADANRKGVGLLLEIRAAFETRATPVVISGNLGPRGDGYRPDARMTVAEARDYHSVQARIFRETDADMLAAFTMNYVEEAIGIVLAAKDAGMPVAISFTVETDGRLPSGDTLDAAIERTDRETGAYAAYYMINCAHPSHFEAVLRDGDSRWRERIRGLRANASKLSHAELDVCTELDIGNPVELGADYRALRGLLPNLSILGGCCGTDHRHVEAIADSCLGSMQHIHSPAGAAVSYEKYGEGPPLVLVHGSFSDHRTNWEFVAPILEKHFTVYAIARRGRGETDATEGHTLEDEAVDVAALLRAIDEPVFLLGHSYGAMTALTAAINVPERVRKLVLYETPRTELIGDAGLARLETLASAGNWDGLAVTFFGDMLSVPRDELDALRASELWPPIVGDAKASLGDLRSLTNHRFVAERCRVLRMPVLLQIGTESPRDLYLTDTLAAALANAWIEALEGQAHEGMTTAPEMYAKQVCEFLLAAHGNRAATDKAAAAADRMAA